MAPKRAIYAAGFKLKVIQFANQTNNCAAARKFGVNEKLVRDWKKNIDIIKKMPKQKCALRGKVCQWPALENVVKDWVLDNRSSGYIITRSSICVFAFNWAKKTPDICKDFKATKSWCTRFMQRNDLVMRQKTKIAQKLPAELDDKVLNFHKFIITLRKKHNFPLNCIGNMDEVPMCFDMPGNRTVDAKGTKTILVKTTGHEKSRFTVVLSCLADGTKLKPMIILKRKTMVKVKIPSGIFVHVQQKGWMDEEGVKLWIRNVWNGSNISLKSQNSKRLLVWDSFKAHLSEPIKNRLQGQNTFTSVIPGGLTSILQPLDVCLNKPFKAQVRSAWTKWLMEGEKSFTKGGNMRAIPIDLLCNIIIEAWNNIKVEAIQKSFKKCGISNDLDGTEDDILWDSDADSESEPDESNDEWDPYEDINRATLAPDINLEEIFKSSDECSGEFEGFISD